jgi:hypothetical protein
MTLRTAPPPIAPLRLTTPRDAAPRRPIPALRFAPPHSAPPVSATQRICFPPPLGAAPRNISLRFAPLHNATHFQRQRKAKPMKTCTVKFDGQAPYSASRAHCADKLPKETPDAYEERTWAEKAHTQNGSVVIPPMAFKMAVDRAAKMLGRQIPGKGKATYTKFFESGVIVTEPAKVAPVEAIQKERIHANADGVRGSGKRVWRNFPRVDQWGGTVQFHIIADEITPDVFEETVRYAGLAVGVGRFRPERGGYFGRFVVDSFAWEDLG